MLAKMGSANGMNSLRMLRAITSSGYESSVVLDNGGGDGSSGCSHLVGDGVCNWTGALRTVCSILYVADILLSH